ncbi:hypothetical protein [Campylobacter hyointestinalis]|uniref:hypothetical protein n=1 Tax=Campylobacter hyointestinalis TaxID=198 RepID=UPI000DCD8054|nr:hypothetical protein [Campylobacter hyointestinalis]RAZ59259.1 hypothetical protein CHL10071_09175 [Campylobacter hyointestinalis subsp. lawsonii]
MPDNNISNNPNSNIIVGGNQTINNIVAKINIDIGRLSNICETNAKEIIELLNKLESDCQAIEYGDDFIKIDTKNRINELEQFYTEFIKEEEAKLAILDDFFKDNNVTKHIEHSAKSIKISIFSFKNRNSNKLNSDIFNQIIQEHTSIIDDSEIKDVMQLIIFYLYRYCYIGEKNGN